MFNIFVTNQIKRSIDSDIAYEAAGIITIKIKNILRGQLVQFAKISLNLHHITNIIWANFLHR